MAVDAPTLSGEDAPNTSFRSIDLVTIRHWRVTVDFFPRGQGGQQELNHRDINGFGQMFIEASLFRSQAILGSTPAGDGDQKWPTELWL